MKANGLSADQARLGQHGWFSFATLVEIRSLGASHCLIRRLNR